MLYMGERLGIITKGQGVYIEDEQHGKEGRAIFLRTLKNSIDFLFDLVYNQGYKIIKEILRI